MEAEAQCKNTTADISLRFPPCFNLQSRCFFLGALTSCVVALHTALLMADPVMLCWAAAIRSVMDCPDILRFSINRPSNRSIHCRGVCGSLLRGFSRSCGERYPDTNRTRARMLWHSDNGNHRALKWWQYNDRSWFKLAYPFSTPCYSLASGVAG